MTNSYYRNVTSSNDISSNDNTDSTPDNNTNILVAYYSNSGNTKAMAEEIQNQTGADIFKITRISEYSNLNKEAKSEIDNGERPEVANMPENFDKYDTIFIGYPIWWDTTPAMINTFLENYDLSDKTIIPFCTSSSDGIEGSMNSIKESASNSNILDGLRLSGGSVSS